MVVVTRLQVLGLLRNDFAVALHNDFGEYTAHDDPTSNPSVYSLTVNQSWSKMLRDLVWDSFFPYLDTLDGIEYDQMQEFINGLLDDLDT